MTSYAMQLHREHLARRARIAAASIEQRAKHQAEEAERRKRDTTAKWLEQLARYHGQPMSAHDAVVHLTCVTHGTRPSELVSDARVRVLVIPRQLAFWVLVRHYQYPLCRVGHVFKRDHTTVLYGVRAVEGDEELRRQAASLADQCEAIFPKKICGYSRR